MKNIKLLKLLCLIMIITSSCKKHDEIPKTGEPFARANSIRFYFCNENDKDLLDLKDNTIIPVSYETTYKIPEPPSAIDTLHYYYDGGVINFDSEKGDYYWNTVVFGKEGYSKNQFYVRLSETDIDTMDVEFSYVKDETYGSNFYAYIDKLYYNGTLITEECRNCNSENRYAHEQIFIQKKGDTTIISFGD